jgi:hypothetical protein
MTTCGFIEKIKGGMDRARSGKDELHRWVRKRGWTFTISGVDQPLCHSPFKYTMREGSLDAFVGDQSA